MLTDKNKIILIIGTVWPEPASSAAGVRTLDLIRLFKSRSYDVKFASASSANEYRDALEQSGVQTFPCRSKSRVKFEKVSSHQARHHSF